MTDRSDAFLDLVRRSREGRLKVFLGPAAGAGKTCRMLQEAHELQRQGIDVVIGVVETHGRPETAALVEGLEEVPRQRVTWRGVSLDELALTAVLARAPTVALVDEVAHSNPPGALHPKRWEDIFALLKAGISVFCAFNIQHLESLNDVVRRLTGVQVRETVPDAFLRRADQVVGVDLPADDLLQRLQSGKIYPAERVGWAMEHFFQRGKIEDLRELALREVAEAIGRAKGPSGAAQERPEGRLMLCLSSRSPRVGPLLRQASRLAGRLNLHWFAVYVETPHEGPARIDASTQRHLFDAQQMARALGAEVHHVQASDPVAGIVEFARSHGVRDIVVGASYRPWYRQLFGRTVPQHLMRVADDFNLHLLAKDTP